MGRQQVPNLAGMSPCTQGDPESGQIVN